MKKIIIATVLIQLFTTSCQADSNLYKEEISELLQNPKTRKFNGGDKDLNDLKDCPALIEVGRWSSYSSQWGEGWDREQVWKKGSMNNYTRMGLNLESRLSTKVLNTSNTHPVYIGPWHYSSSLQKNIRFFAYQKNEGGPISYQYESQTEENKSIKEKEFFLSGNVAPDKFSLCVVKWTAKFGYNAIAEVKSKNPFSKNYLVPTGKIIEVGE